MFHRLQKATGALQELIASDARKRGVILTFDGTSPHTVEKKRELTKVVSYFQGLVELSLVVPMTNDTCANCNEVKVVAFIALLNYYIIWFAHLWNEITYQLLNRLRLLSKNIILHTSSYKNMIDNKLLQT